jgi:hypothetical protein
MLYIKSDISAVLGARRLLHQRSKRIEQPPCCIHNAIKNRIIPGWYCGWRFRKGAELLVFILNLLALDDCVSALLPRGLASATAGAAKYQKAASSDHHHAY